MIVSAGDGGWTLVRQVDHQDQCAAMARAWGGGGFAPLAHHGSVVAAAAMHDEGWRSWEHRPEVDGDGRPVDFPDIDRAVHVALYRAGIDAACARDPRAGLLVSMHGAGLYRGRLGLDHVVQGSGARPPEVEAFLAHEDRRQERLRAALGGEGPGERAWAWAAYRQLQAWDLLSLALLWGRLADRDRIVLRRVPRDADDDAGVDIIVRPEGIGRARLSPWPFPGDSLSLPVAGRRIGPGPFTRHGDLAAALDAAPWDTIDAEVRPG